MRAGVDPGLRGLRPGVGARAYPVGQCLEITRAVLGRLDGLDGDALPPHAAAGWRALCDFRDAGGQVRIAWGDLRGACFQNALIVAA